MTSDTGTMERAAGLIEEGAALMEVVARRPHVDETPRRDASIST